MEHLKQGGIRERAEKYLDDALNTSRVVEYRDARVEPRSIIVKTHEVADNLDGYRGWRFTVGQRKTLSEKAEPVVWATPGTVDFLYWAKVQEPKMLRKYLRVQGISARTSSRYVLAALLTYRYEEMQLKKTGSWPLSDAAMDVRLQRIEAIERYRDTNGKDSEGGMSDEEIIVAVNLHVQGYSTSSQQRKGEYTMSPKENNGKKEETPSEIRARLRKQAEETETDSVEVVEEEEGTTETEEEDAPSSEMEAVRGGKKQGGKKKTPAKESDESSKGRSAPPTKKTTKAKGEQEPEAEHVDEKETEEMPKKAGKKGTVKKAAKEKKVAGTRAAKGSKMYAGDLVKDFPIGSKVKYIGTRVSDHTGKIAEVTGHKDANGLNIKFSDGSKGSATPGALELIKKGSGSGKK